MKLDIHMRQLAKISAVEILVWHWAKQSSLKRSVAATGEEILAFETEHGVSLPGDFGEYIANLNGIATHPDPDSWDGVEAEGFEFHPLTVLRPLPDAHGYFVFCTWILGLLPFAICLDQKGHHGEVISSREGLSYSRVIAPSFTSFVKLYVENSMQLYGAEVADASPDA
jgi:hypothetical protein